jgi:uncharacterized protein YjbJ (UPF0337 family)
MAFWEDNAMNDDQVEGVIQGAAGKIEEKVGNVVGDAKIQASGKARQAAGQAQQAYGQVVEGMRDFATENPIGSLLAAAGLGILLGLMLTRR